MRFPQGVGYTPQIITVYQGLPLNITVQLDYRQSEAVGTYQCELALTRFEKNTLENWSVVLFGGEG
jgi:hypothetical protein